MAEKIPFATDPWIKQLHEEINHSEAYRQAAKTWRATSLRRRIGRPADRTRVHCIF